MFNILHVSVHKTIDFDGKAKERQSGWEVRALDKMVRGGGMTRNAGITSKGLPNPLSSVLLAVVAAKGSPMVVSRRHVEF